MGSGRDAKGARRGQSGFTLLGMLFAVAVFGIGLAVTGEIWSAQVRRERERELLRVGDAFREALRSYYASGTVGARLYPERLEDLLRDPRTPALKRHLRRIYVDPMTGRAEWGLVKTPDGRSIIGVFSLSEQAPLKDSGFSAANRSFAGRTKYSEWRFEYVPETRSTITPLRPGEAPAAARPILPPR